MARLLIGSRVSASEWLPIARERETVTSSFPQPVAKATIHAVAYDVVDVESR